jgi:hypothetical protein
MQRNALKCKVTETARAGNKSRVKLRQRDKCLELHSYQVECKANPVNQTEEGKKKENNKNNKKH